MDAIFTFDAIANRKKQSDTLNLGRVSGPWGN